MDRCLIVLDGIGVQPQVVEFLTSMRDRNPGANYALLIPQASTTLQQVDWAECAGVACTALESLRAAGIAVSEALVGESSYTPVEDEIRRSEHNYDCIVRFSRFRRGIYIQRITPSGRRHADQWATAQLATA
jgi:hypothetical protein